MFSRCPWQGLTAPSLGTAALDFSMWAYLKKRVCSKKHTRIEPLKKDLERAWENKP